MLDKLKSICNAIGLDRLTILAIVGLASLIVIISLLTGKQDSAVAKMSEEVIEEVIQAETGVKLDITSAEPSADVSAK